VDDQLIGGALFRSIPVPFTRATITKCLNGPIFLTWNREWADDFVARLVPLGRESNSMVVSIEDCPDRHVHHDIVAAMHRAGLRTTLTRGHTEAVLRLTGRTMDELWQQFNHGAKYSIKKGQKRRIDVRRVTSPDNLKRAYGPWMATAVRKGFTSVRPWVTLEPILRHCTNTGLGSVLASFVDEQPLASVFITHIGQTAEYVYGGSVDGSKRYRPNHIIHYEAIRECLEKPMREYSFGTLSRDFVKGSPNGLDRFKMAFGCKSRKNLDTITWERRPHLYHCTRWVRRRRIARQLKALLMRRLIKRGQP